MGLMTATGYSRTPKLLKGALIQFSAPLLLPIPNVIAFQYNPESLTRTLKPWAPPGTEDPAHPQSEQQRDQAHGRAQPYDPQEDFTVVLDLDATDALETPESHPVAVVSGVADRIAALEMLLYPAKDSGGLGGLLSGSVSIGVGGISLGGSAQAEVVPSPKVPVVLFFWGPGRIVPVRLTSFTVEEQAFSPLLYPVRAKVSVGMRVLTADAFADEEETAEVRIAKAAYTFTRKQKEVLATLNLANTVESVVGMLPL
ncbi:hypothetical protein ABZ016_19920 [Streptomyces sp. NPDC006372]|uniref:hypothetical protein n=1 Tax=Streptomyces sp. NPDC006372 TaxID=3155599 RepID=UPI0033BCE0A1